MHAHTSPLLSTALSRFVQPQRLDKLAPVLITGPLGTGKRHYINTFLRQIGCEARPQPYAPLTAEGSTRTDCNCDSCTRLTRNRHSDVLTLTGAENLADFREALTAHVNRQPTALPFRFLVLTNLHRYSKEVLDTALKIIEEPPRTLKILATTTARESMPPAVLSRFREFRTNWLSPADLEAIVAATPKLAPYKRHLPNYPFRSVHELTAYVRHDFDAQFKALFYDLEVATLEAKVSALLEGFKNDTDHALADLLEIFLDFYLIRLGEFVAINVDVRPQLAGFKANAYLVFERYAQSFGKYLRSPNMAYFINLEGQVLSMFRSLLTLKHLSNC